MSNKYRIWFLEWKEEGKKEFRYYYASDFSAAVLAIKVAVSELEQLKLINPDMYGLEVWNEFENTWTEWSREDVLI